MAPLFHEATQRAFGATSANFTERGQMRNFEAGIEIEDEAFASDLVRMGATTGLASQAI